MALCSRGAQRVNCCEFPTDPSGVGVSRPQSRGPVGHRTCSTRLLSYAELGPGRAPLRRRFSPMPPTDSHQAGGIPSTFKGKPTLFPPPNQYWFCWGGGLLWNESKRQGFRNVHLTWQFVHPINYFHLKQIENVGKFYLTLVSFILVYRFE